MRLLNLPKVGRILCVIASIFASTDGMSRHTTVCAELREELIEDPLFEGGSIWQ